MRYKNSKRSVRQLRKSVWESLDRMEKQRAEADAAYEKRQAESNAAYEKRQAEYEKQRAEDNAEFKLRQAEYEKRQAEYEKQRAEDKSTYEIRQAAAEKSMEDLKNTVKETSKLLGNHTNNIGAITEDYFFNSIKEGKKCFFGEKFDEIIKNYPKTNDEKLIIEDEYDILLKNGKSIGIIEVKYKAHANDIPDIIRKATTFRINFPQFKDHKIYLGLATMSFYQDLEDVCRKEGIAIIQQVGDTLVVNDGKLKEY